MPEQDQDAVRHEALERVVERVTSWQEGAAEGTVREELDRGLAEAGVSLTEEQRDEVAERIAAGQDVDVAALATDGGDGTRA